MPFIDNIWGGDLGDMQLISKFNKGILFYYVLFIFSVNIHGLILRKIKRGITITNAFQEILDEPNGKPKKIWVDKGSELHNRSMKSWLEKNNIEMYSTHNEVKFIVSERLIRNLNNKIYEYITLM